MSASGASRGARPGRGRTAVLLAIAAVAITFTVVGVPMGIATLDEYGPTGVLFIFIFPTIVLSLTLVGGFVAFRVPDNPVGWLLGTAGLFAAVGIFGGTYVNFDHALSAGLPLVVPIAWLSGWTVLSAIGLLIIYVPMLFPTGRFLSPRWRGLGLAGIVGAVASVLAAGFTPGPLSSAPWIENPLGIPGAADALAAVTLVSNLATPVFFGGAIVSVFVRYRRAPQLERQQLKWFGLVAGVAVVTLVLSIPNDGPVSDIAWEVGLTTLALLPIAIGAAILRYRLWDIDRVISRTLGWALVTGILLGLFAMVVATAEAILAGVTQGQTLAVAASTLMVAALFQPVRQRVQAVVDRRFDRSRYDAQQVVEEFGERLRSRVDPSAVESEVTATVLNALHPGATAVWVRAGGRR